MFVSAIVVAAGQGVRLNTAVPKQFLPLAGKPVLVHTLAKFQACDAVSEIVLVAQAGYTDYCRTEIAEKYGINKITAVTLGGPRRQDSVLAGLGRCAAHTDVVLIHDAARPFVTTAEIESVITGAAASNGACTLGVPAKDTIKLCDDTQTVTETLDRAKLWHIQTPQGFSAALLRDAYARADEQGLTVTDDCAIIEQAGHAVHVVCGSYFNIKITTAEDLVFAEAIIHARNERS